ncbi:Mce family protein [Gordonia effusa NBRC 100432]|uniref:Mce family protein n=1 Tax=Gordonia effusa NBRC 100432 TaxID=1077974 RepID=H0R4X7_9ACTN|nr:MlaD family protein [Gordonia effusa]GAB20128.1 Mce family protein [Gordonia effusa NBRC 100432]
MSQYEDPSGRGISTRQMYVVGLVGVAVLAIIAVAFSSYARGNFTPRFEFTVEAQQLGEGIVAGSDVKMNGLKIGQVVEVETKGATSQRLVIGIEPYASKNIATNIQARFVSSNTLGMSSVELFYRGAPGPQLAENGTITLPADSKTVTVTSIFRKITTTLGRVKTDNAGTLADTFMFEGGSAGIANIIRTAIELGQTKVGNKTLIEQDPRPIIDMADGMVTEGARLLAEALGGYRTLAPKINHLLNQPDNIDAVVKFIGMIIGDAGSIFRRGGDNVTKIIDAIISIGEPVGIAFRGANGFYRGVPKLIDRIDKTFVKNSNGTVSMKLQVILASMPYLAGDPAAIGGSR